MGDYLFVINITGPWDIVAKISAILSIVGAGVRYGTLAGQYNYPGIRHTWFASYRKK